MLVKYLLPLEQGFPGSKQRGICNKGPKQDAGKIEELSHRNVVVMDTTHWKDSLKMLLMRNSLLNQGTVTHDYYKEVTEFSDKIPTLQIGVIK